MAVELHIIRHLGVSWRGAVNWTPRPLYPRG